MLGIGRATPVAAEVDRATGVEAGREPSGDRDDRVLVLRERGDHRNTVGELGMGTGVVHRGEIRAPGV